MSRRYGVPISPLESQARLGQYQDLPPGQDYVWPFSGVTHTAKAPTSSHHRWEWNKTPPAGTLSRVPLGVPPSRGDRMKDSDELEPQKRDSPLTKRYNVAIEVALTGLYDGLTSALALFQAYDRSFESQVRQLTNWALDFTLDELWHNMITDKFREKDEPERFRSAGEKISSRLQAVEQAVRAPQTSRTDKQRYNLERRRRAARKAVAHCEDIVELAERAGVERMACKFVVEEIIEVVGMLDPKTHPNLYSDDEERKGKGGGRSKPRDNGDVPGFNDDTGADLQQEDSGKTDWGGGNQN